jgi:hypothetical protein
MPPRLGIIVPYRDRRQHLDIFIPRMREFFRANPEIDYRILVVEQSAGLPFNRGAIKNIGYLYLAASVDYVCFHDVDLLPISADYRRGNNPAMVALYGLERSVEFLKQLFGGVVILEKDHFEQANGFSNKYWGWGFEDVDLRERLLRCNRRPEHRPGHFKTLSHIHAGRNPDGTPNADHVKNQAIYVGQWFQKINGLYYRKPQLSPFWQSDGLNSIRYAEIEPLRPVLTEVVPDKIAEHVLVSLLDRP